MPDYSHWTDGFFGGDPGPTSGGDPSKYTYNKGTLSGHKPLPSEETFSTVETPFGTEWHVKYPAERGQPGGEGWTTLGPQGNVDFCGKDEGWAKRPWHERFFGSIENFLDPRRRMCDPPSRDER
jgi:hypothetical protein